MNKKFPKINVKFHSNVTTHNQTNEFYPMLVVSSVCCL